MKTTLTILILALNGTCFSTPLDQIIKSLDSGQKSERAEAVAALNNTIDNNKLSNEARLEAIQIAKDMDVHECGEIIIKYIDTHWVLKKSAMSFELNFTSVDAIISLGEKTVPSLIEALKKEDDDLRHRLLSYSLGRILKQKPALAYIDKLLAEDVSAAEKQRLEAARAVISVWADRDTPEK